MPFFIKLRRKWKLLAAGAALLATLVAGQGEIRQQIENLQEKRAVAAATVALKNTGFGTTLEKAKSAIEQANNFFEQAAKYKASAENLQKKNDNANAWGAYQEAWSFLDRAEKSLGKANIEGIGRAIMRFKAVAPAFADPGLVDYFAGHSESWLNKLKKEHDKLKSTTSEEKAEIFKRIDAIEAAGAASVKGK